MNRHRISERILYENLRLHGHRTDPKEVEEALYERNGVISVIPKGNEPTVLHVDVDQGVQTIRFEIRSQSTGVQQA